MTDLRKARAKWAGGMVNPDIYAKPGGVLTRLDPDDGPPPPPPPPPPPGTELAMPAGGVSAVGLPSSARYGTAADFYDSIGVNIHFQPGNPGTAPSANVANSITDLAALGVRHIRDSAAPSYIDSRSYEWRAAYLALNARNQALPAGEQPIFLSLLIPGTGGWEVWTHRTRETGPEWDIAEWLHGLNGGSQHRNPGWGSFIADGTTSNPDTLVPNPWNDTDPEFPWDLVGSIQETNEPGQFHQITDAALRGMKPFFLPLKTYRDGNSTTACYGSQANHAVVTPSGLRSKLKVRNLPISGPSVVNAGQAITVGDWTASPSCDVGDAHPYHPGQEPSHEHFDREVASTTGGLTTGLYNGNLRNPPDRSKALPFWCTEFGFISAGFNTGYPGAHSGYWPATDFENGEYMARQVVLYYWRNVRRCFVYYFYDEFVSTADPEGNFGLVKNDRTKKPQFYSLRNLLSLVGFSEAPQSQKRPLPFTVSGFASQGAKYQAVSNSIVGGGGTNRHTAMYAASGVAAGGTYETTSDRLDVLQLQQSANTWIIVLCRHVMLWDREPGNWNTSTNQPQQFGNVSGGRFTPNTQNITLDFGEALSSAQVAQPTSGLTKTTSAPYYTWANPDAGRTWADTAITNSGKRVVVPMQGNLKLVKVTIDPSVWSPGLTSGTSADDLNATGSLGADVVRVEFDIQTAPSAIQATINSYAARGARVLLLAGFDSYIPTTGQAQNVATWAAAFGPGGTFWANRTDGHLAVQHIEFGNETSFGYQFGNDGPGDASYTTRAQNYAHRFVSAISAIAFSGKQVGLLCQADDGGSGSSAWVDNMFTAEPGLAGGVSGWTVHPYGPTYLAKTGRVISQTGAHGASSQIPIDVTECGVSSDNGANLTDNYGWATNMTYAQAASTMNTVVANMRNSSTIGPRLRHFMVYQVHDQQNPGVTNGRESYFGAVRKDLSDKGAYSPAVRAILAS